MAAPNRSSIKAKIVRLAPVGETSGKSELELEVFEIMPLNGPTFAKLGQVVKCFTFEVLDGLSVGDQIVAEVEYIGDARGGLHQITKVGRGP